MPHNLKNIYITVLLISLLTNCYAQLTTKDSIFNIVDTYIEQDNKEEALKIAIAQLDVVTKNKATALQIKWNRKIGELFSNNNNPTVALSYYNKAKQLCEKTNDSLALANVYFDIGSLNLTDYTKQSYLEQKTNVALDKRDAAFKNFNFLLAHFKNIPGTEEIFAKTYANLTGMYSYTSAFKQAEIASKKAIEYYQKLNDTLSIIGVKINLGVMQIYQEKFNEAERNYLETLAMLKDTTNIKILRYKEINYANLAHIYATQKRHEEANKYLSLSHQLNVLYLEMTSNKTLEEIEAKYNQDKARQEEIAKTKIEIEKKEKTQLVLGIAAITAIALLLLAAFLYRNSKLKAKNLELKLVQKEFNQKQQLQKLREQTQNKVINATLDGRLKERKYIAQTLHDSVSALLSSANMHLQVVKKKSNHPIEELEKSQRIIEEAADKVRDLSHKLISAPLIKFGLEVAIHDLCEKYSNDELTFKFATNKNIPRLEQDLEIKIFNIVQEITNNIIKHSKASLTTINLNYEHNQINITIKDNGIGFETNSPNLKSGVGLDLIQSRIELLKGQVHINSAKNKGTKITLQIPIKTA